MKLWALVTVGLYLAAALLLSVPLLLVYRGMAGAVDVLHAWCYWLWIGLSAGSQVLLLAVPVALSERRPRSRRHLLVPLVTAALLLTILGVAAAASLSTGIWGDKIPDAAVAATLVGPWVVWAVVFRRLSLRDDPQALTRRLMGWLLRGSILELLIAVPSHVIARHRNDCCAPYISFWGIVTGITVMLLSFGPGVFFLFAARMRRRSTARAG